MQLSTHAKARSQQRGIPPLVVKLVQAHGAREYDHQGGVICYVDKRARRSIEKEVGTQVMRRLDGLMDVYLVESAIDGAIVTMGHRHKRINRN